MKKSIMQQYDGRCYLCEILDNDYTEKPTEEHHVLYGTANHKLAEKFGLKVRLCEKHHRNGPESIHGENRDNDLFLKKRAQMAFEAKYPELDFRAIFGKSYL